MTLTHISDIFHFQDVGGFNMNHHKTIRKITVLVIAIVSHSKVTKTQMSKATTSIGN